MCKRRNKHRSRWFIIPLLVVMIINIITPSVVYAAEPDTVPFFFGDQDDVWCEESTSGPTMYAWWTDLYPATYVGAQELYGPTVNWPHYRGETSTDCDDYYYYKIKVHGTYRSFYDEGKDEDDYEDDIRVHCLCHQMDFWGSIVHGLGSGLGNAMRSFQIGAFTFLVEIKDFDLLDILDVFTKVSSRNNGKSLSESIKEVILIDEDGNLSPFMFLFLILWICGMTAAVIKFAKGEGGFEILKKEIGFLILSVVLFGIIIVADAPKKISEASIKLVNVLNTGILDSDSGDIFDCEYDDDDRQLIMQQRGIFIKASIDSSLCAIFDCESISDLDIGGSGGLSWPSGYSDIGTVGNGSSTASNIGYMLWAGQSRVDNLDPYTDGPNYMSGGDRNNIYWLIPDILQESGGMDNATMVKYADQLNATNTWGFVGKGFLFWLEALFFVIAELFVVYLVLCGKIFLVVFGFLMMVLPGLFLWDRSRRFATDICRTYVGAFLRVVMGDVLFMTLLLMFTVLTENNDGVSMVIGILLFILLAWNMPKRILPAINQMLMEVEGNGMLATKCRSMAEAPLGMAGAAAAKTVDDARRKRAERKARKERERLASQNEEGEQKKKNAAVKDMARMSANEEHDEFLDIQEESGVAASAVATDMVDVDPGNAMSGVAFIGGVANVMGEVTQPGTEAPAPGFKESEGSEEMSADTIKEEYREKQAAEKAGNKYSEGGGTSGGTGGSYSGSGRRPSGSNFGTAGIDDPSDTQASAQAEMQALDQGYTEEQKAQFAKTAAANGGVKEWSVSKDEQGYDVTFNNGATVKMKDVNQSESAKEFRRDVAKNGTVASTTSTNGGTQQEIKFEKGKKITIDKPKTEPQYGYPEGYFADSTGGTSTPPAKPRTNKYSDGSGKRTIKINKDNT